MWNHIKKKWRSLPKGAFFMTACFFLLLLGPNLLAIPLGGFNNSDAAEKRKLAEFPTFSLEHVRSYPRQMESFINDHAAFRSSFLSFNSILNLKLFHFADSDEVIAGKDGWYFITSGMALKDVLGIDRFTQADMEYINACVKQVAGYYEKQGIDFVMMLPSNKGNVYDEYLPDSLTPVSETRKGDELAAYLAEHSGVPVLHPGSYLRENDDFLWYYKTDTHWNDAAGFAASQMIIEALGGTPTSIDQVSIRYTDWEPGDLTYLFHLPARYVDDVGAVVDGYLEDSKVTVSDVYGDERVIHTENPAAPDGRRVAFYRDSFSNAIIGTLSKYFKYTDFYSWVGFDASLIEENRPDAIVYEVVERDQGRIVSDLLALCPEAFAEGTAP